MLNVNCVYYFRQLRTELKLSNVFLHFIIGLLFLKQPLKLKKKLFLNGVAHV